MKSLYFDQAATSFPKAPGVGKAMLQYLTANGANINRGSYNLANEAAMVVLETREALAQLFHCTEPVEQVIFTPGCTWGLNMLLKGYLSAGDHVIVSSLGTQCCHAATGGLGRERHQLFQNSGGYRRCD